MPNAAPAIVTFTTDFGLDDFYVGTMKGALLRHCPTAVLIDITHAVPRHDILFGSIMLERAVAGFPPGSIHVAVVDPGVGTSRRIVIARWPQQTVLCPDNGLLTSAWQRHGPAELFELAVPATSSAVFHGRDVMAPAAGRIAAGMPIEQLATPCSNPVLLPLSIATDRRQGGVVIHIDRFGNAMTNIPSRLLTGSEVISVNGVSVGPIRKTYGEVPKGTALALIGSSDLLEIAVSEGSARELLGIEVGSRVTV